ncbi:esterase [Comamonas serinivorans]|uniref:Esterase n=1 Tax=Comamonas serinivorans TaxID=1082851 RepID=A0A1Y0EJP5_9BURK|nr:YqiA/YcfP family alpha/beta fold hydrolase [Comamonas serinivorans]ARU03807.1 esterase [Comamonas serinivorans]
MNPDLPALAPITHLLYLHGFRSSPQSNKARQMAAWMQAHHPEVHWWCPQLPPSPAAAAALIDQGTRDWPAPRMAVMGSSLGGFYATWLAQRRGCRAALINPAVQPERDLARHLGTQSAWHDPAQQFDFTAEHLRELEALQVGPLVQPEQLLAIIAQGDEVLDWREMTARYPGSPQVVVAGGDHALSDFEPHLPTLARFFGLTPP